MSPDALSEADALRVRNEELERLVAEQAAELEAARREAEIEAALEHVRGRTMAMRTSDELTRVAELCFEQSSGLGIRALRRMVIIVIDPEEDTLSFWSSSESDQPGMNRVTVPMRENATVRGIAEGWLAGEDRYSVFVDGEAMGDFVTHIVEHGWRYPPGERPVDRLVMNCVSYGHGVLDAIAYEPLADEDFDILARFARVFEQTYTRFLDLKQAEAQAREAQIEAALERVRARTMAMRRSEDLVETASILFQEVEALGIDTWSCGFTLCDPDSRVDEFWVCTRGHLIEPLYIPTTEDPATRNMHAAWKRGEALYMEEAEGDALEAHYAYLETLPSVRAGLETVDAAGEALPTWQRWHAASFSHGYLMFITQTPFPETEIFIRFARVFEQTYTRFLDLKQAEEQAREAQIEAALERVRARTMAMQSSEELGEVVSVVFDQLQRLDFNAAMCTIIIYDQDTEGADFWLSSPEQAVLPTCYRVPFIDHPVYKKHYKAWQEGVAYQVIEVTADLKRSYDDILFTDTDFRHIPAETQAAMRATTEMCLNEAFMSHGVLESIGPEPLPEGKADILKRFARVIDLTYTRIEDLQQAEARARDAVREASLDRVRAEIASMRTADDLERITPLVWRELTTLGVPFFRCGVFIVDEAAERVHTYLSTPEGQSLAVLHLPFDSAETTRQAVAYWRNQQVYTDLWDRRQFVAWVQSMREQGHIQTREDYQGGEEPPEALALHFVPFAQGMLYVGSAAPLAEDQIDLVQALADAFAVAYARYEDFQRLEAKNREVEEAYEELRATQQQLIHAEKMASLGALTAGIAHEIKNPLNFVNNFSELAVELAEELGEEIEANLEASLADVAGEFRTLLADLKHNASKIHEHGRRADAIVRAMMQHARGGEGHRERVNLNTLVSEYVDLAWHGRRASTPDFAVEIAKDLDDDAGEVEVVPQEIGRVVLNLVGNAFDAVEEQAARADGPFAPRVEISTRCLDPAGAGQAPRVEIRVADNGPGISEEVRARVFEPFFTTKPTGSGTGLGLSLSYDIVTQGHGGTLTAESAKGEGAAFVVSLPAVEHDTTTRAPAPAGATDERSE